MSTSSTPSVEEIRELGARAQPFIPEAAEHTPHTFLSLAPHTSNSYPKAPEPTKRRTSSQSSNGGASRLRVLKLGPVHYGEHAGDHKGDWHEVAIE